MATATKKKRGFLDGYKTYDTSNGFGNESEWKDSFYERMGVREAEEVVSDDSPYSILGVAIGASLMEIKKAFRALALKLHPDQNNGDDREFRRVLAAYTILTK